MADQNSQVGTVTSSRNSSTLLGLGMVLEGLSVGTAPAKGGEENDHRVNVSSLWPSLVPGKEGLYPVICFTPGFARLFRQCLCPCRQTVGFCVAGSEEGRREGGEGVCGFSWKRILGSKNLEERYRIRSGMQRNKRERKKQDFEKIVLSHRVLFVVLENLHKQLELF